MELLVVGAGAMGRWFADALVAETDITVTFADTDPEAATAAAEAVGGRTVALESDKHFDVVCLATPLSVVEDAVADHATKADRALVDITGVMAEPVAAMRRHAPERERISLHPLFAPANEPGNIAVVADDSGPVTDEIRAALSACGNTLFDTTSEEHDTAMETVQARTHAAVLAYALTAEDVPEKFHTPISGPLDELATQVLDGTPDVYAEIQAAFDGAEDIAAAAERIAGADTGEFEELYREACESRGKR